MGKFRTVEHFRTLWYTRAEAVNAAKGKLSTYGNLQHLTSAYFGRRLNARIRKCLAPSGRPVPVPHRPTTPQDAWQCHPTEALEWPLTEAHSGVLERLSQAACQLIISAGGRSRYGLEERHRCLMRAPQLRCYPEIPRKSADRPYSLHD